MVLLFISRKQDCLLYTSLVNFQNNDNSVILDNEEFGYWDVEVLRPAKNDKGETVMVKGKRCV